MTEHKPRWYQEAILYELHIRAFFDSNHDGSGDFRGLIQKLDYLQDLGVTALWLLPFYPSPLKDDGYDIANYTSVHSTYGNLADFKLFLREAHQRNMRVITELVLNHTSDQHPWFQRARRAKPGSPWRDFYMWHDNAEKYPDARIIFTDSETSNWAWDPIAKAYYWHRFYSHQPDLNYDNPAVQKAAQDWMDFWLEMGVDGLRLDAVPYLFAREGTHCENLPETHQFLKKLRKHIDEKYPDRMLLAEANQWPEDAITYFGNGDECNMAFHFPLMPRMFMSLQMEDRFPLVDIMQQTPQLPKGCQWSIFLRNHDELTLEMVTDEERDYMYRVYAQDPQARINLGIRRRLAPLLNNNRKKIELMNGLLFSFPGTPVIYYGDEIGMGDNFYLGDRNGVRTPMQWSADRNAGFSQAHPHRLFLPVNVDPEYHYESINVAAQQNNPESLLWWMKKLIALRKRYRALSLGTLHFLHPDNSKILAYITQYQDEKILVLSNLSRFSEHVELDLSPWKNKCLIELFSQNSFPAISDQPYFFTLGPYSFYWFSLETPPTEKFQLTLRQQEIPLLHLTGDWDDILKKTNKAQLEIILCDYLVTQRWFGKKSQPLKLAEIIEIVPVHSPLHPYFILFINTRDAQEKEDTYFLPIGFMPNKQAVRLKTEFPAALIARLPAQKGYVMDACYHPDFARTLLRSIAHNSPLKGKNGTLTARHTPKFHSLYNGKAIKNPHPLTVEQSNTSISFDHQLILKCYRRCQDGVNPELEISRFLSEKNRFPHTPDLAGDLEYQNKEGRRISVGILQKYCPHETDAWQYTLKNMSCFFENILAASKDPRRPSLPMPTAAHLYRGEKIPATVQNRLGNYGHCAHLLGQRTAEMHRALASDSSDPNFSPEPFTTLYQRTLYQSIRSHVGRTLMQLRKALPTLPQSFQNECQIILKSSEAIDHCIQQIFKKKINGVRTRIHGDFHLGQALYTGKDFILVDFEGEPARSLSARRVKYSPLRDIAGMLRSFDYAAQTTLFGECSTLRKEDRNTLQPWAVFWRRWACVYFLQGYFENPLDRKFLPDNETDIATLLTVFSVEKAIYEIQYELNNRPDWLLIPCRGLLELLA